MRRNLLGKIEKISRESSNFKRNRNKTTKIQNIQATFHEIHLLRKSLKYLKRTLAQDADNDTEDRSVL